MALGALLGLSWALLGALETLLGAILSDLGSLQHVLRCSWKENWSKDVLHIIFLGRIFTVRTSIFGIPYNVFKGFPILR